MNSNYVIGGGTPSYYPSYYCHDNPSDSQCGKELPQLDPNTGSYDLGFDCGKISFASIDNKATDNKSKNNKSKDNKPACTDPASLSCALAKAQVSVLPNIILVMDTIAKKFVQLDYEYQNFYYTSTPPSSINTKDLTPDWIKSFCTAKNLVPCCASVAARGRGECPRRFGNYSPIISEQQPDSVKPETLTEAYIPYGLLPYLNDQDFIEPSLNQYIGALTEAYTNYLTTLPPPKLTKWRKQAEENGWILAGMYYYTISKQEAAQQVSLSSLPGFIVAEPKGDAIKEVKGNKGLRIRQYRNNSRVDTEALFSAIAGESSKAASSYAAPVIGTSKALAAAWIPAHSMLSSLMSNLTKGNGNPLFQLAASGYSMMVSAQLLFWITVLAVGVIGALLAVNPMVLGSGMTVNPLLEYAKAMWGLVSPFFILMIASLYSMGAIIGIYLPLLPYIIFTMGAIGWIMTTLEAMVAGPLIALGILSPSGQHELLGKAEPAVMILFNLVLRPGLMVFGMMASMFVAIVVIKMINTGFAQVAFEIIGAPGIFESLAFFVVYVSLIMMALNKVFSLIHVIPEKVLMYIGGQAISYGESEGLAGAKQALEGSAGAITGASKESGSAATGGVTKAVQDQKVEERENEENAKKGIEAKPFKLPKFLR
jgi:hypothetical protein